jgi:hypothetical protein
MRTAPSACDRLGTKQTQPESAQRETSAPWPVLSPSEQDSPLMSGFIFMQMLRGAEEEDDDPQAAHIG